MPPFVLACQMNQLRILKYHGTTASTPWQPTQQDGLVHLACAMDHTAIVRYLLKHNAVNADTADLSLKITALYLAGEQSGDVAKEICELPLDGGVKQLGRNLRA